MERILTVRELLRGFGEVKKLFLDMKVQTVYVPIGKHERLKLSLEREETPFVQLLKKVEKRPLKGIKRPSQDLFS